MSASASLRSEDRNLRSNTTMEFSTVETGTHRGTLKTYKFVWNIENANPWTFKNKLRSPSFGSVMLDGTKWHLLWNAFENSFDDSEIEELEDELFSISEDEVKHEQVFDEDGVKSEQLIYEDDGELKPEQVADEVEVKTEQVIDEDGVKSGQFVYEDDDELKPEQRAGEDKVKHEQVFDEDGVKSEQLVYEDDDELKPEQVTNEVEVQPEQAAGKGKVKQEQAIGEDEETQSGKGKEDPNGDNADETLFELMLCRNKIDDGPDLAVVDFELRLMARDGSESKISKDTWAFENGEKCITNALSIQASELFGQNSSFISQSCLTIECKISLSKGMDVMEKEADSSSNIAKMISNGSTTRTRINKKSFSLQWSIEEFSKIVSGQKLIAPLFLLHDGPPLFMAVLSIGDASTEEGLQIDISNPKNAANYITCEVHATGMTDNIQTHSYTYFPLDDSKLWRVPFSFRNEILNKESDSLLLRLEFEIYSELETHIIEKTAYVLHSSNADASFEDIDSLKNNLLSAYQEESSELVKSDNLADKWSCTDFLQYFIFSYLAGSMLTIYFET